MEKKIILQDLAETLSQKKRISQKDAENFVRIVFETISDNLKTDKLVKVKGLGTFKLVTVDSRESVNVNTGERIIIKAYTKINFTPDNVLRDTVNKPFAQFDTVVLNEGTDVEEMARVDEELAGGANNSSSKSNSPEDIASGKEQTNSSSESQAVKPKFIPGINVLAPIETAGIDEDEDFDENNTEDKNVGKEEIAPDTKQEGIIKETRQSNQAEQPANQASLSDEPKEKADDIKDESVSDGANNPKQALSDNSLKETPQEAVKADDADKVDEVDAEKGPMNKEEITLPMPEGQNKNEDKNETKKDNEQETTCAREMRVESQSVELQKVEHLTVEHQHIVRNTQWPAGKRYFLTRWMLFFLVLLVIFLMAVSYYIGYNHSLLFSKTNYKPAAENITSHSNPMPVARPLLQPSNRNTLGSGVGVLSKETRTHKIVGTKAKLYLGFGETLQSIAKEYYGDEEFYVYIVEYNHIKNPDTVPLNTLIKIPELRLKEEFAEGNE